MNRNHLVNALRSLGRLAGPSEGAGFTDRSLLERYATHGEQAAFAALVERHGGLVWGVCRRALVCAQDADDAFQATFLVLLHKAGSLRNRESLAGFLQGVAWRLARRVQADAVRRRSRELKAEPARTADTQEEVCRRDLRRVLDEELDSLPEKYRAPLVLCYLEGKSYAEAARHLGWANGTVCGRLARARELLRGRLARRGLAVSGALLATVLTEAVEAPAATTAAVVRTAGLCALGQAAEGVVSSPVAALADVGLKSLAVSRLKTAAAVLLAVALVVAGAGLGTGLLLAAKSALPEGQEGPQQATVPQPPPARQTRSDFYGDALPPGVLARMGTVRLRQEGAHLAITDDGKTLISAGDASEVWYWDMASGARVRVQQMRLPKMPANHAGPGLAGLSPDGKVLATFLQDRISLYNTRTGEELNGFPVDRARDALFSLDGKQIATFTWADGKMAFRLWDVTSGKTGPLLKHDLSLGGYAFSSDGKFFASADAKETILLWETASGKLLRQGKTEGRCLAFSTDGKTLAAGDSRGTVTLLDTANLTRIATLERPGNIDWLHSLEFSRDGSVLAVGGEQGVVLWDTAARKVRHFLSEAKGFRFAFTPDGKTLACAGHVQITLWDVTTGRQLLARPGHDNDVWSVAPSPDSKVVVSASWSGHTTRSWDAATGKALSLSLPHPDIVRCCAYTGDGKHLVSASRNTVWLWDAATGRELRHFVAEIPGGGKEWWEVLVVKLSADGKHVAAVSSGGDQPRRNQLTVWDAQTGKVLACRPFRGNPFACFTSSGEILAITTPQGLILDDTITGQELGVISGDVGHVVAFSPDDRLVAVGINKTLDDNGWQTLGLRVAEVATGQEVFHHAGWHNFAVFSSDGRVVVTTNVGNGHGPHALHVWDAITGQELFQRVLPRSIIPLGDWNPVNSLALMPNGRAAITGLRDGTILVWDLEPQTWPKVGAKDLTRKDLNALWADLAAEAPKAYRAIRTLAGAPTQVVPFVAELLRPVGVVDASLIEKRIAELDSDNFAIRKAAAAALADMGGQAEPALRRAVEGKPSAELRRQVGMLLAGLHSVPPAETVRTLRAIAVLERIGTPDALLVLRKLAGGAAAARETRDAKIALARLARRPVAAP
jgi:RNA polymerase sigma factor (sigma-70 family)